MKESSEKALEDDLQLYPGELAIAFINGVEIMQLGAFF